MPQSLKNSQIVIVGGGLSGLTCAILLARKNLKVTLFEKKTYPFHRVCGEYISNEVLPFLEANKLLPNEIQKADISKFQLSSIAGKSETINLGQGGFGISRYLLDDYLAKIAIKDGVDIIHDRIENISFANDEFTLIQKSSDSITADVVIGAHGKRSLIDKKLQRTFINKSSPYVGIKHHIHYNFDTDTVALHNFPGGYCGINAIENGKFNLCYLSHRSNLKKHRNIQVMEKNILSKNPHLRSIFNEAEFLFEKPEVINEISFETKSPVEDHILMCGDAAGMITPLCGNGMAMAIHSAKILSEEVIDYFQHVNRLKLEETYKKKWSTIFKTRLAVGRHVQKLFGSGTLSGIGVNLLKIKPLARGIIKQTHGQPF